MRKKLIGIILLLNCIIILCSACTVLAANYDFSFQGVCFNNSYTKYNRNIRVAYDSSTKRYEIYFQSSDGKTYHTKNSTGIGFTNGKILYFCQNGTNGNIYCFSFTDNSSKSIYSGNIQDILGCNGKYIFYTKPESGSRETDLYRYNVSTKKSARISKKTAFNMKSGSKRFNRPVNF